MMANQSDSEEEQFFDTSEEIDYFSDKDSDCSDDLPTDSRASNDFSYEFWTRSPESVYNRRSSFFQHMGLKLNDNRIGEEDGREEILCNEIKNDIARLNLDSGAVLRNSTSDYSLFSRRSSMSCSSTEEDDFSGGYPLEKNNIVDKSRELDNATELNVGKNGIVSKLRELGSNKLVKKEKLQESGKSNVNNWLKKLRVKGNSIDPKGGTNSKDGSKLRKTRVRLHKKKNKELSSLFEGQDFCAHEGLILAIKFSPDGRYLASAGEDGVVRVWEVTEDERENNIDMQSIDFSCLNFSVDCYSKLVPIEFNKEKKLKVGNSLKKSTKPGCVIFPYKVFRILEKPIHEFRGHCGEVLALSWSSNECLLSSSVDKTVRLWQLGNNECIGVFSHNNYVTSVEFNPVDNNYFISGSIDGKIRIWEVSSCQVVDWIDIRDIVTAVCYYPNGKRGIVGSMDGSCRFYDIIDNQLQLDTQIFLPGKKKLPCKRITGFQFSPSDSSKVLVTSADSQVRVLSGSDVIFKLKGPRMSGSQVTASFTEDGKHIISSSEDSNIHLWDHSTHNINPSKSKIIGSCETFVSQNSSIAIPYYGLKKKSSVPSSRNDLLHSILANVSCNKDPFDLVPSSSKDCFSMGRGIFVEPTWPEEKLFDRYLSPNMSSSHMWGLVIVTAGRDGRIKTHHNYGLPVYF